MGIFDSLFKSSSQCLQPSADGSSSAAALSGAHPDFRLWSSLAQVTSRGLHSAHTHQSLCPVLRGEATLHPHTAALRTWDLMQSHRNSGESVGESARVLRVLKPAPLRTCHCWKVTVTAGWRLDRRLVGNL